MIVLCLTVLLPPSITAAFTNTVNNFDWFLQVYRKPMFTDDLHIELYKKSKKIFNSRQLAAMKNLYAWRDKIARLEDESIGYLFENSI